MHYNQNPLAWSEGKEFNKLFYNEDLKNYAENYLKENAVLTLPENFRFVKFSFKDERENNKEDLTPEEVLNFWNNYYTNKIGTKTLHDKHNLKFWEESRDSEIYGVKFKNTLIATQTIEYLDLILNGETFKSVYGDFLVVHPKFRGKFLVNVLQIHTFYEIVKNSDVKIEWWASHRENICPAFTKKTLYTLPLTDTPKKFGLVINDPITLRENDGKYFIRKPTVEEITALNTPRYKLQYKYSTERLTALINHELCFTDGENIVIFTYFSNVFEFVPIKTAVLIDFIKANDNFYKFFRRVIYELKTKEKIELITLSGKNRQEIINKFNFERNSEMYLYAINIFPKVKQEEIQLNIR